MCGFHADRLKKLTVKILKYILIGFAYYIFIILTGLKIPCISRVLFNLYCPGCGVTRMCMALLSGNFSLAFRQNQFVFCLFPVLVVWGIYKGYKYVFNKKTAINKAEQIVLILVFIVAVTFAVLRNLQGFEYLAPLPW